MLSPACKEMIALPTASAIFLVLPLARSARWLLLLRWSRNPATQGVLAIWWVIQLFNHRRIGRMRRFEDEFALLNDEGHDYACLHYYIDQRHQRRCKR